MLALEVIRRLRAELPPGPLQAARDGRFRFSQQAADAREREVLALVQPKPDAILRVERANGRVDRGLGTGHQTVAIGIGRRVSASPDDLD